MNQAAFSARLTRIPRAFDPEAGADAAAGFPGLAPEIRALIAATAGCSPYLKGLMQREADWLCAALSAPPEGALASLLAEPREAGLDTLGTALRQAKRRAALLTALCDLGGVWSLEEVTGALTGLADLAVDLCVKWLVAEEIRRGKLPGATPSDAETAAGMVVLAMGKMGAGELNYSSDIDLICLFDQDRYGEDWQDARAAFIRVTRKMTALISDVTGDGYVFRTDLRLRPDASVTPVCLSMAAAYSYYEAEGRTWERAAYIKARPCGGDLAAGEKFLKSLTPFVWRRHLDYAAIQDAHDMRLRIRDHRGLNGPLAVENHNIKLGQGGIREIEFFTQTRQLIAGGRDPDLRDATTVGGLSALAAKGWIPAGTAAELTTLYRAHRELEHRLQMVGDAQTQTLPATPGGVARIAAFMGEDEATFREGLLARLTRTDQLTEGFFAPSDTGAEETELSDHAAGIVEGWKSYPCLRSDRARAIFRRLRPQLLARLSRAASPDEALVAFDGFLAGLPAGVQLFALFEANPSLVDLIVDIAGTAPELALYLSRNARVLDAVIGGSFFEPWPGVRGLTADLAQHLAGQSDYERSLDEARRWMKEWHFRVGVHHLRGLIDSFEAGKQYADLAEAVVAALWPVVLADFSAKHGAPPGRGAVLLAMGSLGAGRLNARSDLDLILIYDANGVEQSEGRRPLPTRSYYARLTQAMVTALSAQTAGGRLYEVDVRLRPSGRQGPVATSLASWRDYQETEAWTWEHLALTRARVVAGDPTLGAEVETTRRAVIAVKGQGEKVRADVAEMRARLFEAKPARGEWETKNGPGRLMDIELIAEMLALIAASPARQVERQLAGAKDLLPAADQEALARAWRFLWSLHCAARLLSDQPLQPEALGEGGRAFLLRQTGESDETALLDRLRSVVALAADVTARHSA
ncbi:bifunctional [glutamine synthetase] adenylyltransferase/[glutamine synthetase]-adenylyl-L-tyrosine phosphorylase [Pseudogemmobacter humi]|uniref:Glutamate-ammonia-ligase adenylyltransferase n=1 Tax=Pseudogemmobacter humi TaxID=2483812 RepID=A0A3P5XMS5_9RHOB|nr:bifunctional [glutamine synthetase] adenylyltransferase/[glutamine synthetase]-adenylyl-L-tyrosine phosphorylase [Pseudogemmobacter humi]VDC31622.1 Glutamate-ammonia-ligase adenylyltransferase [Pseudogemmobacter humi]